MRKCIGLLGAAVLTLGAWAAGQPLGDTEWQAMKRAHLERPRRLIINDDGCDATNFPEKKAVSVENFYAEMLDYLKGTEFGVVSYCPGTVGFTLISQTKIGDRHLGKSVPGRINATPILEEKFGKDPMRLALEFARANRLEFWGCMRINDIHDRWYPQWLGQWKKEHPEYLCGTADKQPPHGSWTAYDFGRSEVRERFAALIDEMVRNYDLDGIEIDFTRNPCLFKSAAWGKAVTSGEKTALTAMMRRIRENAERVARERRRPILIGLRLPDSAALCERMGVAVADWMKEGLFDLYFAGSDDGHFSPLAATRKLCSRYGIQYYPSVDHSWINGKAAVFNRNRKEGFDGQFAAALQAGADGLYLFNMFYELHYLKEATGSAAKLARRNKLYFVSNQRQNFQGSLPAGYAADSQLPELHPARPALLRPGKSREYLLQIGDDFSGLTPEQQPQATLHVRLDRNVPLPVIELNSVPLAGSFGADGIYHAAVPLPALRSGENRVRLTAAATGTAESEALILKGDTLLAGANQPPWRRLFAGQGRDAQAEAIENGAYVLRDRLDGANGMVNLLYPLGGIEGNDLTVDFELQVLPGSEPMTSVLRIANGDRVEVIDFRPDAVVLGFNGNRVALDGAGRFVHYRIQLKAGKLEIAADGKVILSEELRTRTGEPRTRLGGYSYSVPEMDSASLLIGSLSGPGRGGSAWRNLRLNLPRRVEDLSLEIRYPRALPPQLGEYARIPAGADLNVDFSAGKLPDGTGLKSSYRAFPTPAGKKGMMLENEVGQAWHVIDGRSLEFMRRRGRMLTVEWTVSPLRESKTAGQPVFQMVMRPLPPSGDRHYEFVVRSRMNAVVTPWGEFPAAPGAAQNLKAVLDLASGEGAVYLDGKLLAFGKVGKMNYAPGLLWGDISSEIGGAALIEQVKATLQ